MTERKSDASISRLMFSLEKSDSLEGRETSFPRSRPSDVILSTSSFGICISPQTNFTESFFTTVCLIASFTKYLAVELTASLFSVYLSDILVREVGPSPAVVTDSFQFPNALLSVLKTSRMASTPEPDLRAAYAQQSRSREAHRGYSLIRRCLAFFN